MVSKDGARKAGLQSYNSGRAATVFGSLMLLMLTDCPRHIVDEVERGAEDLEDYVGRRLHHSICKFRNPPFMSQACTSRMNLSEEVDLEDYVGRPDKISNADISAICQEAGMHAVRKNRYVILPKDFEKVGRFKLLRCFRFSVASVFRTASSFQLC